MDRFHLPDIENVHDNIVGAAWIASENVTTGQVSVMSRYGNSSRDKRRSVAQEQVPRKKRASVEKQRRMSTKAFSLCGGKVKSTRSEGKNQNVRRRNEVIGFPNIGPSAVTSAKYKSDSELLGARRARRCKAQDEGQGDTISYVYSKSLRDKNCMAFLRNCIGYEKGIRSYQGPSNSALDKKPYGLPSLKTSGEFTDKDEWLGMDSDHETPTESYLNGWDMDGVSNVTNDESPSCSPGNKE